jgi:YVTN family beta-propeller protein
MTVSVIDTELALTSPATAVIDTIVITADPPKDIAISPEGAYAYVTTGGGTGTGSQVSVLDLSSRLEVDIITVGTAPRAVAFTPDGKYAYVTNLYSNVSGNDDDVYVIDTESRSVVDTIVVGDGPKGIVITQDGKYAFVANSWGSTISVIDIETNQVVSTIVDANIIQPYWLAIGKFYIPDEEP